MINVNNINGMFSGCSSLKSLPDISNWNTGNIINMNEVFSGCSSLKTLPDISKWNIENVTSMNGMFSFCSSLEKLPNISKWKANCIINMKGLFFDCLNLEIKPEISKWILNTQFALGKNFVKKKEISTKSNIFSNEIFISNENNNDNNNSENKYSLGALKASETSSHRNFSNSLENYINREKVEPISDYSELLKEISFKIMNNSTFEFHNNMKGKKPFIIYDRIEYNDINNIEETNIKSIKIDIDKIKNLRISLYYLKRNYELLLDFLKDIENSLKEDFKYNYKFTIKLSISMGLEKYNKNSIFNINCEYKVKIPNKGEMTIPEINILEGKSTGYISLINNLNCEENKNLEYNDNEIENSPLDYYYENFYNDV